jgi:hypothetical protein
MSQVIITRNSLAFRRKSQRERQNILSFKPFLVVASFGLVISFLSVMMLVHFNHVATKGYTIKYLEVQQQNLWEKNEQLKKDLLKEKALTLLMETEKAKSMIKPPEVTYVIEHSALAKKY